ncbi:helix-turn-helix transcriptional regulator [Streptomyces sp. NA02950]|uniref:winged helix-turn-helix transcriptional regulator n=1 Tax=Streptomyces sp. NA02950 TaxID=2742137 RepID=UPI0015918388|nr:helix-turn-helix domain-containing protein [Streptomyces sp. NA02950]QKV90738.1 helix-turn-helix transcriptional regulator [Streptomyces sp. NA02950]
MVTPTPGRPVRGSTTGRPLMAALDLFGRRWSLRVVWELHEGALGFRALRGRCGDMSSSVLRQRLVELIEARLVHQTPDSHYALTPLGRQAYTALSPLVDWSATWATELAEHSPDPGTPGTPDTGQERT